MYITHAYSYTTGNIKTASKHQPDEIMAMLTKPGSTTKTGQLAGKQLNVTTSMSSLLDLILQNLLLFWLLSASQMTCQTKISKFMKTISLFYSGVLDITLQQSFL
jgi:hypothetical protein